jgi:hypothetical protein
MCTGSPITIRSGLSTGTSTAAFTKATEDESNNNDDDSDDTINLSTTAGLEGYKTPCAAGKHCKRGKWLLYPESFVEGTKKSIHSCIECSLGMHSNCNIIHQSHDMDNNNFNLLCLTGLRLWCR